MASRLHTSRRMLKFPSLSALAFTTLTLFSTGCPDGEEPKPDAGNPDAGQPTGPDAGTPGPTPPEFQACSGDVDQAIDGDLDDKWTFFYDDKSFPTKDELDHGRDGTVDQRDEWSFDERGNLTGLVMNGLAPDGTTATLIYEQADVWSADDLLIESLVRFDQGEGSPPFVRLTRFKYDDDGKLIERTIDRDADGTINSRITYTFDANGRHLTSQTDSGLDGTINSSTAYVRDADGRLMKQEFDFENDGTPNMTLTYRYDSEGRYLGSVETMTDDPTYAVSHLATFDAQGRRATDTSKFSDTPEANSQSTYLYDCASGARQARPMLQAAKVRREAQLLRHQVRSGKLRE
jgi:serralysin